MDVPQQPKVKSVEVFKGYSGFNFISRVRKRPCYRAVVQRYFYFIGDLT